MNAVVELSPLRGNRDAERLALGLVFGDALKKTAELGADLLHEAALLAAMGAYSVMRVVEDPTENFGGNFPNDRNGLIRVNKVRER